MSTKFKFDYDVAFQRNLGFLNPAEQQVLKSSCIAIVGLGGTGGAQVHALTRLGIGGFHLADLDTYELANFNRQLGATMDTIGREKVVVMDELIKSINPEARVNCFNEGINSKNIHRYLENVDLIVDSLDFYCFKERFLLYRAAREKNIWVITSPPLGFGCTLLNFDPQGMSFEDYFGFDEHMEEQELAELLVKGIAPNGYMMEYLNEGGIDLEGHQLPSVGAAPFLVAGIVATEVMRLLTRKRPSRAVPEVFEFDALLHQYTVS